MFNLQVLCENCHKEKQNMEREKKKKKKVSK